MIQYLERVERLLTTVVKKTLFVLVFTMVFLTVFSIVARWFQVSFLWIDPLVRHMVLISAFMGGYVALDRFEHISIDLFRPLFAKMPSVFARRTLARMVYLIAFITCVWLAMGGVQFTKDSFEYEGIVFLGIHRGVLTSIIPAGFFIFSFRILLLLVTLSREENLKKFYRTHMEGQ